MKEVNRWQIDEAFQTLWLHNEWRRGKNNNQLDPKEIGLAIDLLESAWRSGKLFFTEPE